MFNLEDRVYNNQLNMYGRVVADKSDSFSGSSYGVDYGPNASKFESCQFNNLGGRLPKATGWWTKPEDLVLIEAALRESNDYFHVPLSDIESISVSGRTIKIVLKGGE